LDITGELGGFNFQIVFSQGFLCAKVPLMQTRKGLCCIINIVQKIYFDEIIKDDKLIPIFQNENTAEVLLELYDNFEPRFTYYKTLGLFDISFYSTLNEHILNFQDSNFQDNFVLNLVEKVIATKKDILELKNSQSDTYIVLVKPIIDSKLNLLAVVGFEFDFNNILERLIVLNQQKI